jgi:transcription elongation GreA/GreB family factor
MQDALQLRQTKTGAGGFTKVFAQVKKSALRDAILHQLRNELATQANAAVTSRDEAISEESRAENKWDTHSQEAAYLAEGQARLAAGIADSIELYTTLPLPDFGPLEGVAVGAVVELESPSGKRSRYFIGPRAGGLELNIEGINVLVLTPQSPLGRQLLGKRLHDTIATQGRGPSSQHRIIAIT